MPPEDDPVSPQAIAADQSSAIRDVLYVLESATVEAISEEVNLPVDVVYRRLNASGPGVHMKTWQRFAYDKVTKLWSLTALGVRESETSLKRKKRRA